LFRVAARNEVGLGAYSDAFSIIAATVPGQPGTPITSVDGSENNIIVTWSQPSNTGGMAITGYRLYVETSSSTW